MWYRKILIAISESLPVYKLLIFTNSQVTAKSTADGNGKWKAICWEVEKNCHHLIFS